MSNQTPSRHGGPYFQVPLCAFAFGKSDKERLDAIICFGVIEAGRKRWKHLAEPQRQELLNALIRTGKIPDDFRRRSTPHVIALFGADALHVRLGSVHSTLSQHDGLLEFQHSFERQHGKDPLVRLKAKLVFEARDRTGVTSGELAILAAIFSVVGKKKYPVLITQDRIRRRALGYKTEAVFEAEFSQRQDGVMPLTDWQLRSLIERLHTRKFFARATYGRRLTYYSHRMTDAQLRKAVVEMKTLRFSSGLLARHDDATMTDAIRNFRAATAGKPPPAPDARPLKLPGRIVPEDIF
jgi:hypothetical protein